MKIVGRVALQTEPTQYNKRYMATKRSKLGHMFTEAPADNGALPHGDHA